MGRVNLEYVLWLVDQSSRSLWLDILIGPASVGVCDQPVKP